MHIGVAHHWQILRFVSLVVFFTPIEVYSKADTYTIPQFNNGDFCKSVFPSDDWDGIRSNKLLV